MFCFYKALIGSFQYLTSKSTTHMILQESGWGCHCYGNVTGFGPDGNGMKHLDRTGIDSIVTGVGESWQGISMRLQ